MNENDLLHPTLRAQHEPPALTMAPAQIAPADGKSSEILLTQLSWYTSAYWKPERGDEAHKTTLRALMKRIKGEDEQGEKFIVKIERLRKLKREDTEAYEKEKKLLHAFTPGGTFSERGDASLIQASGFLHFDIDGLNEDALDSYRELLAQDKFVSWFFVSPSGSGIKGALSTDKKISSALEYTEAWLAMERYFLETYEIKIDAACKNISRLCFLSYDPDFFFNPDATPLDLDKWNVAEKIEQHVKKSSPRSGRKYTREEIESWGLPGKWQPINMSGEKVIAWRLDVCPWGDKHTSNKGGASVLLFKNGQVGFHCFHAHCQNDKRDWQQFRVFYKDIIRPKKTAPESAPPDYLEQYENEIPPPTEKDLQGKQNGKLTESKYHFTDLGNATHFVDSYCENVLFIPERGRFFIWDGNLWSEKNSEQKVSTKIREMLRQMWIDAHEITDNEERIAAAKFVARSENNRPIKAIRELASLDIRISKRNEEFNVNPFLLNVQNGTIDLTTGEFRKSKKDDYLNCQADVEYNKFAQFKGSFFERVLSEIFLGDADTIRTIQTALGYSLTGKVTEHCLFFLYGLGSNGKSTLMNLFQKMLGDYGASAPPDMLLMKTFEDHPTEIASLNGRRFVSAVETSTGRGFNEARLKLLTGGDSITARRMREDHFTFLPTHKFWISGNHKPTIRNTDDGIWRRIILIPFNAKFGNGNGASIDKNIEDKLLAEKAVVLNWAIEGCLDWQRNKEIFQSQSVLEATKEYRSQMDLVKTWSEENCVEVPGIETPCKKLFADFEAWCTASKEKSSNIVWFSRQLSRLGFESERKSKGSIIKGLALQTDAANNESDDNANHYRMIAQNPNIGDKHDLSF